MRFGRFTATVLLLAATATALLAGRWAGRAEAAPPTLGGVQVVEAWPGVAFSEPIALAQPNDGSDVLYVLEQPGTLKRCVKWRGVGPVQKPQVVLDLASTGKVHNQSQGGALGLTFHPQFPSNGRFFLTYLSKNANPTLPFKLVVSEFRMQNGVSSPSTERVILEVPKTRPQHQAGGLGFGPDGKLYIGVGDNAGTDDKPEKEFPSKWGNAQAPDLLLGKILRLDVDVTGKPYGIPSDNPWAAQPGVRGEVWAYGFRNPWRFGWDEQKNMWLGEPGSKGANCREWVTEVVRGGNHGWPFMEGNTPNPNRRDLPPNAKFVPRAFDYGRTDPDSGSCAIGGQVYRGARLPALRGKYIFCDYELFEVYALTLTKSGGRAVGSDWRKIGDVNHCVSIDMDAQGELYFCQNDAADSGGSVWTLAPK